MNNTVIVVLNVRFIQQWGMKPPLSNFWAGPPTSSHHIYSSIQVFACSFFFHFSGHVAFEWCLDPKVSAGASHFLFPTMPWITPKPPGGCQYTKEWHSWDFCCCLFSPLFCLSCFPSLFPCVLRVKEYCTHPSLPPPLPHPTNPLLI